MEKIGHVGYCMPINISMVLMLDVAVSFRGFFGHKDAIWLLMAGRQAGTHICWQQLLVQRYQWNLSQNLAFSP